MLRRGNENCNPVRLRVDRGVQAQPAHGDRPTQGVPKKWKLEPWVRPCWPSRRAGSFAGGGMTRDGGEMCARACTARRSPARNRATMAHGAWRLALGRGDANRCRRGPRGGKCFHAATAWRLHLLLVDQFVASFDTAQQELVLDFDVTDNPLYGQQEARSFHGDHDGYRYMPPHLFQGQHLPCVCLRPSRIDGACTRRRSSSCW